MHCNYFVRRLYTLNHSVGFLSRCRWQPFPHQGLWSSPSKHNDSIRDPPCPYLLPLLLRLLSPKSKRCTSFSQSLKLMSLFFSPLALFSTDNPSPRKIIHPAARFVQKARHGDPQDIRGFSRDRSLVHSFTRVVCVSLFIISLPFESLSFRLSLSFSLPLVFYGLALTRSRDAVLFVLLDDLVL